MGERDAKQDRSGRELARCIPAAILVAGLVAFFLFDLDRFISFEALHHNHAWLVAQVAAHGVLAMLVFVAVYAAATALSIPGAALLTIAGGFLFGTVLGAALAVTGATIGATAVFLAARTALGDTVRRRAGSGVRRMEAGFRAHALSYLLVLRLIPIFPFWLVNLVPALLHVPLSTYVVGTFLGIIPGGFVYASLGNGLGAVLETEQPPDLGVILEPEILGPIGGLALLALLPVLYKAYKGRRGPANGGLPS